MSKTIPTVTHLKNMTACQHKGGSWNVALSLAMQCMGVEATIKRRNETVQQLIRGHAVMMGGHVFHGELT